MFKSSLFLILVILPIALSSDRLAKLESTDAGKTVLNTLMIQTKLKGVNADAIKTVLEASQVSNQNGLDSFEKQAVEEKAACAADAKSLKSSLQEAVSKRYSLEKTNESTSLLKERKSDYAKSLEAEVTGYTAFLGDISKGQAAWSAFFDSMAGSIKSAQTNLAKIRAMVEKSNPHNAASFAQTESKESMANEIRANLEYRFYDTLGMKPILTGLVEVASKGITTDQFYKISHTMDLIDNFLADRNNNLIEDNEYETTLNTSLTNSINDSVTSTKSELEIVNGLIGSLDTRIGLLGTAVQNAVQLSTYARNVLEARAAICADFAKTYFNHVRRYNSVRLTIAELSNTFDEEYKDFESFLQKKMSESS
jgi:dethiobiotin synthetase